MTGHGVLVKKRIHIVSYTHWDREFRWEFEQTRMKLVECMDHLLEIMGANPEFKSFMLDGQVGLVDDYLEIRPEQEETIRALVAAGRLEIGPWYSLPDCATVHGEAVLRNLQHGVKVSQQYGDVMRCGYNVFSFGQIAQLPQIYRDFGIDVILFYKRMHPRRTRHSEFVWESPDGTRALASRLGPEARWNFFFAGHVPIVYNRDPWHRDWRYEYGTLGKVMHTADPEGYSFFHEILDPETSYHKKNIEMGFKRSLDTVRETAAPETLLFFDGTDFTEPHPLTPDIIAEFRERFGEEYEIRHSKLSDYLSDLKKTLKDRDLDVVGGPMRDGPVGSIHTDVITTHPEIKLINAAVENRLVRYAEPLAASAWVLGIDRYPHTYLDKAWKLLFQSHAHDSVHGLGPVELAQGTVARMRQADNLAKGVERKALGDLTKEINTSSIDDAEMFLAVHNTATFPRSEVVEAWVDIPADVALKDVVVEDMDGTPSAIQELSRQSTRGGIYHARSRNMPFYCTRVQLLFQADHIPAMGYKTYKLKWKAKPDFPYPHEDWDAPRVVVDDLLTAPRTARNESIALSIDTDGSLSVTDLETGHTFRRLNTLTDQGDRGNMWMFDAPDADAILTSEGLPATIACLRHGPLAVTFRIEMVLRVPARFDFSTGKRSDDIVEIKVVNEVSLKRGRRYVEIRSTVTNTARDHYLKVCFPTGLRAETTCADGSFGVEEYSTRPDLEAELARHPTQLWFDLHDGKQGLAILSRSTKDYEILDENGTDTLAMGLLRGTRLRIACDNRLWMEYPGDESGQSLATFTYEYAICPHHRSWSDDALYRDALAFNQPLKPCQFGRQTGCLALAQSLITIEDPNVVLSAIMKADERDGLLVRVFNPTREAIQTHVTVGFDLTGARRVSLADEPGQELPVVDRRISIWVGRGEIFTFELIPEKQ